MTNYERIKNMSVEEMAKWLDGFEFTNCKCCEFKGTPCSGVACEDGCKMWLESEVEEE